MSDELDNVALFNEEGLVSDIPFSELAPKPARKKKIKASKYKDASEMPESLIKVIDYKILRLSTASNDDLVRLAAIRKDFRHNPFPKYRILAYDSVFHQESGHWIIYLEFEELAYMFDEI